MAEKEKVEKSLVFPIEGHTNCPHCGGKERICRQKIEELKRDGLLEEQMFPKGPVWAMPFVDPTKPIMVSPLSIKKPQIPILSVYWDVCANPECLGIYVTGVDFIMKEIDIPQAPLGGLGGRMPGGPGQFPFNPFNKG